MDQGVTSPGDMSRFLRIAYYLTTVLSAVLTIGSLRGERFTLPTGAIAILDFKPHYTPAAQTNIF